jgi:hypothetical protein
MLPLRARCSWDIAPRSEASFHLRIHSIGGLEDIRSRTPEPETLTKASSPIGSNARDEDLHLARNQDQTFRPDNAIPKESDFIAIIPG